jgi:hypothetical protein
MRTPLRTSTGMNEVCTLALADVLSHRTLIAMDPTLPSEGIPGETERLATPTEVAAATPPPANASTPAGERASLSSRVELVAALLVAVVGLEFLSLIIGVAGGGPYRSVGDRIELVSLNLDAKLGLILLVAGLLATLRDTMSADFDAPRSDLGRRTLIAAAALGVLIAILALIGVGLDLSRSDATAFGTNAGAAVIHRLAIVLMASVAAGWSLSALGVRIITAPRK